MKFLILALCVAAASAASVFSAPSWQRSQASAQVFPNLRPVAVARAVPVAPVVKTVPVVTAAQVPVVQNVPSVATRTSAVVGSDVNAQVLRFDSDVKPDGYAFAYETDNGISAQANGDLKRVDDTEAVVATGSYRYVSPEGVPVVVSYVADENGYQPQSDLLPVGPAIPEAILRSLEYIRTHAPKTVPQEVVRTLG